MSGTTNVASFRNRRENSLDGPAFADEIHLPVNGSRKLIDQPHGVEGLRFGNMAFDHLRQIFHQRQVGFHVADDVRPADFDRDFGAIVMHRLMHLSQRTGGDGFGIELGEEFLRRHSEFIFEHLKGTSEGNSGRFLAACRVR